MAGEPTRPIPMTVLGGYLGSGKTTLLNEVLASDQPGRIAVIVNDFGSVNIDADLVRSRTGDTLELTNGCVCCDLADGMAAVMERIRGMQPVPDHVIVEVSGVGDPRAVARWAGHPGFRLHLVLVCVDVETVRSRASDRWVADTVRQQLASAGELLLTRTDVASPDVSAGVRRWLAREVPDVPVTDDRLAIVTGLLRPGEDPVPPADAGGADTGGTHDHAEVHRSFSAESDNVVDLAAVYRLLKLLPAPAVRAKGVLRTRQEPDRRTVVQWAGTRVEASDDGPWRPGERSALVVITAGPAGVSESLGWRVKEALRQPSDVSVSGPEP